MAKITRKMETWHVNSNILNMANATHDCPPDPPFCDNFHDHYAAFTVTSIICVATTVGELIVQIYFWRLLMHTNMLEHEDEGPTHRYVFKYLEYLWEPALELFSRLITCDFRKIERRLATSEKRKTELEKLSVRVDLSIMMIASLSCELFQRLMDYPYVATPQAYSKGDQKFIFEICWFVAIPKI